MTVNSTTSAVTYAGTGATNTFNYTWQIAQAADLVVWTWTPASGSPVKLALTTDYTVSGAATPTGGDVTLVAGNLPVGTSIFIGSDPLEIQSLLLQEGAAFNPADVMNALDLLTREVQATRRIANNALQIPVVESLSNLITTFPIASQRANQYPAFDSNGNAILSGGSAGGIPISPAMVPVVEAATLQNAMGLLSGVTQVATIAALRALTGTIATDQAYVVLGYYAPGDLGGGSFYWNPTDTTADNGGTIIKPTAISTGRFHLITQNNTVTLRQFGATGNGTTDDTAAYKAAVEAAAALHGTLVIDPGTFLLSSSETLSNQNGFRMIGCGSGVSILEASASGTFTNGLLAISTGSEITISDIGFNANNVSMGGGVTPALYIVSVTGVTISRCEFTHIVVCGICLDSCSKAWISDNQMTKDTATGTYQNDSVLVSSSSSTSTDIYVVNNISIGFGMLFQATNCYIIGNVATGAGYGGGCGTGEAGSGVGRYVIVNNVFSGGVGQDVDGVYVCGLEYGGVGSICIGNVCFGNNGKGIACLASNSIIANNVCFGNGLCGIPGNQSGISMGYGGSLAYSGTNTLVSGNQCYDGGGSTQAYGYYEEDSRCVNNRIVGNQFLGNVTGPVHIVAAGASYDGESYEGKLAYAGGTLTNGTSASFSVTVTGAVLGDFATASLDVNLQGLTISAYVSAANTVNIIISNATGGSITLGASNFRARIVQHWT